MKNLVEYFKATVIGGVVFLIPLVAIVVVLSKAFDLAKLVATPLGSFIPLDETRGIVVADILASVILVATCLIAGLLAQTSFAKKAVGKAERRFLWRVPGYAFVKSITGSVAPNDEESSLRPVLANLDDATQVAFEVERLDDGRVVVYVPGAPNPWSGDVLILDAERVEPLPQPMVAVLHSLRAFGQGTNKLLDKNRDLSA